MSNIVKKIFGPEIYVRGFKFWRRYGTRYFFYTLDGRLGKYDVVYEKWAKRNDPKKDELNVQKSHKFAYSPKISIVVPTFNTPLNFLEEMLQSVQSQTYSNWELCIADGCSTNNDVKEAIKKFANAESRVQYVFLDENFGISGNTNAALNICRGNYIAFMDHDDVLAPNALFEAVTALQTKHYDFMYSDEDLVSADLMRKLGSAFKPDFSPQLLECNNYITHMVFVSRALFDQVGLLNPEMDGAQDYDFVLRCTDATKKIHHIPHVLYHWRCHDGSVAGDNESKMYAYEAGKHALQEHFARKNIQASVEHANLLGFYHPIYKVNGNPLLSVIIPNKDHSDMLERCVNSLFNNNDYQNFEVIVVENNSEEPQTFDLYKKLKAKHKNIHVVNYSGDFNYSKINNFGVENAHGQYLLLLNNDTEIIKSNAITEMLGMITQLPEVGAVGAKLFYEDGRVQHCGVIVGFNGAASHVFSMINPEVNGYMNRAKVNINYSCVTAACMMVSTTDYKSVGGFSEEFAVALNDVDFCMKLRNQGRLIVCNNFSHWYHYESVSRGQDDKDAAKTKRFNDERQLFRKKWPEIIKSGDPYYNQNFEYTHGSYRLAV